MDGYNFRILITEEYGYASGTSGTTFNTIYIYIHIFDKHQILNRLKRLRLHVCRSEVNILVAAKMQKPSCIQVGIEFEPNRSKDATRAQHNLRLLLFSNKKKNCRLSALWVILQHFDSFIKTFATSKNKLQRLHKIYILLISRGRI